jgi:hypothetical protein
MYVLAGLPLITHKVAAAFLEGRFSDAIVHAVPANAQDGALYGRLQVETLLQTVGSFAVRRRVNGPDQPAAPASITLLYVPAPDQERLLQAFDFAVLAIPLPTLVAYNEKGRQLRHNQEDVEEAIAGATSPEATLHAAREMIAWRISRHKRSDEGLLLPPRNFLLQDGNLEPYFRQFRSGDRTWDDRLIDLGPSELTHEDLPKRIAGGETRRVFVDSRGMAFLMAHPAAFDGPPRELDESAVPEEIAKSLRALYRFGGALPRGIHHDAQRADGSPLQGATFHCAEKGEFGAKGPYANVYPNDYVRTNE